MDMFDVLIVGYGPVGKSLALMLARKGYRIGMVERWKEAYPFPRAVCMDHEIHRVMSALDLGEKLAAVSAPSPRYQWFNGTGQMLLDIDWTIESISGGPEAYFFHQPSLEAMLDRELRRFRNVEINLGWEMVSFHDDGDGATLVIQPNGEGARPSRELRGRYLVGADGANSMVRTQAGIAWLDLGFEADWLVVDVEPNEGVTLDIPEAGQHCNPLRPTTFVPGGIDNGRRQRRWEFMKLPGEDAAVLNTPERVWELLSPWVKPDQAKLVRHALYTFRSLVAADWRKGRVLLAGDAAHLMPPFMGQGMCSGIRDAFSLAWRLDYILSGKAPDWVLDSYTPERRPHVTQVIDISVHLGRIICVAEAEAAARRDHTFIDGTATPPPPFPSLTDGFLQHGGSGEHARLAGTLAVHGKVECDGLVDDFDRLVGQGFVFIGWDIDPAAQLSPEARQTLAGLGVICRRIRPAHVADLASPGDVIDVTGKYEAYFRDNAVAALLMRPDFYVFGTASGPESIADLAGEFTHALTGAGGEGSSAGGARMPADVRTKLAG